MRKSDKWLVASFVFGVIAVSLCYIGLFVLENPILWVLPWIIHLYCGLRVTVKDEVKTEKAIDQ